MQKILYHYSAIRTELIDSHTIINIVVVLYDTESSKTCVLQKRYHTMKKVQNNLLGLPANKKSEFFDSDPDPVTCF